MSAIGRSKRQHPRTRRTSVGRKWRAYQLRMENLETRCLLAGDLVSLASEPIRDPFSAGAVTADRIAERAEQHPFVAGQLVVAVALPGGNEAQIAGLDWSDRLGIGEVPEPNTILSFQESDGTTVALVGLDVGNADVLASVATLEGQENILWSSPNFYFADGDPRELIPNDPQYGGQYHHPLMQNNDAWDITLGDSSIIVAVTDDGVDTDHQDLIANIWSNSAETPGNGVDDDGNGYVDDVEGWDFVFDNNDPNPNSGGDDHGTHVAGIAAGDTNNGLGIAGTAGAATIMPLQFAGAGQPWTAANIAETFAYAVDNGAQITTTSYNINGWVGDPVFTAGLQYLYDQGGLHFNSAGNGSELNPARQAFEQTLLVVSTDSADVKSGFSNYGDGVDISAPGSSVLSTVLNNGYGTKSGTSMAAPNAAGVAALIWSANPTWTREQVAAQLLATADNIDGSNPGLEGLLGGGRVNSFRALTETIAAPQVESLIGLPDNGGFAASGTVSSFELEFDQVMDPASVNNAANYELREAGPDGTFDTGDDVLIGVTADGTYLLSTNQMDFDIDGGSLGIGNYRFSLISGGLQNPFANGLDGNGDGTGGDNHVVFFTVGLLPIAPSGSLIYEQELTGTISSSEETDIFAISLDANQTFSVGVTGRGGLTPMLEIRDPGGVVVATGSAIGQSSVVQALHTNLAGTYEVLVSGMGGTTGDYSIQEYLNAVLEEEELGGASNDTPGNAQDLEASAQSLGTGGATKLSAVGTTSFGDNFETGMLGSQWTTFSSQPQGRIRVSSDLGGANGTQFAMLMDRNPSGADNLNEAIWTVDLSNYPNPTLSFYHAEWNDEHTTLPLTFNGSANGDGVSISEDGITWHRIFNPPNQSSGVWQQQTINLANAASSAGISLGANFQIKFQQFDNFPLTTDGRGYDEIFVSVPSGFEDWYEFDLTDGQVATVAATALDGSPMTVELYDAAGTTLLATGVGTSNVSSMISGYVDATNNAVADNYKVRVLGDNVDYSIVVTKDADFDAEPNNSSGTAQNLNGFDGALGYVETAGEDYYEFSVAAGDTIEIDATLPADGPHQFVNQLSVTGSSTLRLELSDPGGTVVANGIDSLTHVAGPAGDYELRVFAVSGQGEYFVDVDPSASAVTGDFNNDTVWDCADLDALVAEIVAGTDDPQFDMNGDGFVDLDDIMDAVDGWLAVGGANNPGATGGNPFLAGDANLDGTVDGLDFLEWNGNKFGAGGPGWCAGDFNADGAIDGQDFLIWNGNKFQSSSRVAPPLPVSDQASGSTTRSGQGRLTIADDLAEADRIQTRRIDAVWSRSWGRGDERGDDDGGRQQASHVDQLLQPTWKEWA